MEMPKGTPQSMSTWGVAALGVGSMVGAGIFTLLGEATLMTGRDVYLAFLMGGAIALLSGYSYARLAARFPGPGGITDYFKKAFPSPVLSGGLSILFLIGLLIGLTMLAKTFGAYAAIARAKGFLLVAATPLTRSSYHAGDDFAKLRDARNAELARKAAVAVA